MESVGKEVPEDLKREHQPNAGPIAVSSPSSLGGGLELHHAWLVCVCWDEFDRLLGRGSDSNRLLHEHRMFIHQQRCAHRNQGNDARIRSQIYTAIKDRITL